MLALFLSGASAQTYSWTTIAGSTSGTPGFADGTNNNAAFYGPLGMAQDQFGTLYVVDHSNQTLRAIQSVGTNWITSTLAGQVSIFGSHNGTNSQAQFNDPADVIVNTNGTLYVSELYAADIRQVQPVGTNWVVTTLAGVYHTYGSADGTNTAALFVSPTGMAFDASNEFYVADTTNSTIRLIASAGSNWVTTTVMGMPYPPGTPFPTLGADVDGTNGAAQFFYPSGVAVDTNNGHIYIVDTYNNSVRMAIRTGTNWVTSTIAGSGSFFSPGSSDGTNQNARFDSPVDIIVDNAGNLYVADSGNNTIRKITPAGSNWVTTTIGGIAQTRGLVDGLGANARFNNPSGITVDKNGTIHVVDSVNNVIREGVLLMAPSISSQPPDLSVTNGSSAGFNVTAAGSSPLFYQWRNAGTNLTDGGNISGSLTTNLLLSTTTTNNAGGYAVIVSNTWGSVTSRVANLTIIVPNPDSVGDGITDAWRAQYFGGSGTTTNSSSCATCDADHTGQNNKFKYIAGLDPTNSTSIFQLVVMAVTNLPSEHLLLFNPIVTGRTYTPQFATNLPASIWSPLTSFAGPTTNGNQATVTDLDGSEPNKFYHIGISFP